MRTCDCREPMLGGGGTGAMRGIVLTTLFRRGRAPANGGDLQEFRSGEGRSGRAAVGASPGDGILGSGQFGGGALGGPIASPGRLLRRDTAAPARPSPSTVRSMETRFRCCSRRCDVLPGSGGS